MKNLKTYIAYLVILAVTNLVYKHILNKNNRIEYYFFQTNYYKYKTLKFCTIIINICMFIYLRFVVMNLYNIIIKTYH
jgi:hypothetical protein